MIGYCRSLARHNVERVVNSQNDRDNKVGALIRNRNLAFVIAVVTYLGIGVGPPSANAIPASMSTVTTDDTSMATTPPTTNTTLAQSFITAKQAIPSADAYVAQNFPSKNYGSSASLAAYGTPIIVSYLKFTLPAVEPGQTLLRATLTIKTTTAASDGSRDTLSVYRTGNAWQESTLTYPNRPSVVGNAVGTISSGTAANTIDAIPLAAGALIAATGVVSLAIQSSGSDSARFYSRESPFQPILELTYQGPLPPLEPPAPGATAVVMAAGDLVCPPGSAVTAVTCKHQAVHDLIVSAKPDRFIALGDLAQGRGSYAEFMAPGRYSDTFGDLRNITLPVVGNHEGYTKGAQGYFDYWYGAGVNSGAFGDRYGGYYTTTIGSWRFIGLSSECAPYKSAGGCGVGSPQYRWLQSVLARNTARCTVAAFHIPRWTTASGTGPYLEMAGLWDLMATNGVDITLSGHHHLDEIFKPIGPSGAAAQPKLSPTGIRSFIVGTGGASHSTFAAAGTGQFAALDARARGAFGALRLELRPTGYSWKVMPIPGATLINSGTKGSFSGSGDCH